MCADIRANTAHQFPVAPGAGIQTLQSGGATFRLARGVESLASPAATVLANNNNSGPAGGSVTTVSGTLQVIENGICLLPSAP